MLLVDCCDRVLSAECECTFSNSESLNGAQFDVASELQNRFTRPIRGDALLSVHLEAIFLGISYFSGGVFTGLRSSLEGLLSPL